MTWFLDCSPFVVQGSRGHTRGRVPPGRVHRRVNNGRHCGVLRVSTAGELIWVDAATQLLFNQAVSVEEWLLIRSKQNSFIYAEKS